MFLPIVTYKSPSSVLIYDRKNDQFFDANTRSGGLLDGSYLDALMDVSKRVAELDLEAGGYQSEWGGLGHSVKLRSVMVDDKAASLTLFVDYLYDASEDPLFTPENIRLSLGHGSADRNGMGRWVMVRVLRESFRADSFNAIADQYYGDTEDFE